MPSVSRTPTIKGIAPIDDDEVGDLDIFEVDGEMPRVPRVSVVVPRSSQLPESPSERRVAGRKR